jgi:hypothetical protein
VHNASADPPFLVDPDFLGQGYDGTYGRSAYPDLYIHDGKIYYVTYRTHDDDAYPDELYGYVVTLNDFGDSDENISVTAINNQANNTEITPRYRTFNWTKVSDAGTYSIRIGNSTDAGGNVTDVFLQLDNITVNSANCTNSFLNTSDSASPYSYNYWENSTHCFFYLPYAYNISYTGEHNYQVRALTKV